MNRKKKLKLKKFRLHPATTILLLIILTFILSGILSIFEAQTTYNQINENTGVIEKVLVSVRSLCNVDGLKFLISNAATNFITFSPIKEIISNEATYQSIISSTTKIISSSPLLTLIIALLGVGMAEASGLLDTIIRKRLIKLDGWVLTFLVIFFGTISSLINEIGYVIIIPLGALIFLYKGRSPLLGIIAAFCGVAFGYGVTIFVGSLDIALIPYTQLAARLIDSGYHVGLSSNLIIMIASSLIMSIIGTIVIEKIIIHKVGTYKITSELKKTQEIKVISNELAEEYEQSKISKEKRESKGLKAALITSIVVILVFIYMLIPHLPGSGLLLDMKANTYVDQLFGEYSYFQDGFTFMVAMLFLLAGLAYGIGAKTIKSDNDVMRGYKKYMNDIGEIVVLIFLAAQLISLFDRTNIGIVITGWLTNLISELNFTGVPLIILVMIVVAISNLFLTNPTIKWTIISPIAVPLLMQSNISPEFAQFIFRAADSTTKGMTVLLPSFIIFLGYLNMYNPDKRHPIGIAKAMRYVAPYFIIIAIAWIFLILFWYVTKLPIGPGIYPTI